MKAVKLPEHDFTYKYKQSFHYTYVQVFFFRFLWSTAAKFVQFSLTATIFWSFCCI